MLMCLHTLPQTLSCAVWAQILSSVYKNKNMLEYYMQISQPEDYQ